MLYLETSSFPCLHVNTSFLGLHPSYLGGLSLVSQGVFTSQATRVVHLPRFH